MSSIRKTLQHRGKDYLLRSAEEADVPALRTLLNAAYKELADRGWNYTATYQDEALTLKQLRERRTFTLFEGEDLVGTINAYDFNEITGRRTLYLGKFAIHPSRKRSGLGSLLMNFIESLATEEAYESLQLDTAKPAEHLVNLYLGRGYKIIGETRYEGKTYESWIFEKLLG